MKLKRREATRSRWSWSSKESSTSTGSAALEERCLYEQQEGALHFVIGLGAVSRDHRARAARPARPRPQPAPLRRQPGALRARAESRRSARVSGLDGSFDDSLPDRAAALDRSLELQSTRRAAASRACATDAAGEDRLRDRAARLEPTSPVGLAQPISSFSATVPKRHRSSVAVSRAERSAPDALPRRRCRWWCRPRRPRTACRRGGGSWRAHG